MSPSVVRHGAGGVKRQKVLPMSHVLGPDINSNIRSRLAGSGLRWLSSQHRFGCL